MSFDFKDFNEAVSSWDLQNNQDVKARATGYGITHRDNSPSPASSISLFKSRLFQRDGQIVRISKTFPRQLIYTHVGAGKGRGGTKGSRWTDKYGARKTTNPGSLGKMGTGGRQAKPFIADVMQGPNGIEKLSLIAAEKTGQGIIENLSKQLYGKPGS